MIGILFLGANPDNQTRLSLAREYRTIDEQIQGAAHRALFRIEQGWAVRPDDLQGLLQRSNPTIVHFCGHGNLNGELVLEDEDGTSVPVNPDVLSDLFRLLGRDIRCVVLNACFSDKQAAGIVRHIDVVIGMSEEIRDTSATAFAAGFYEALGFGQDIQTAFELACNRIDLRKLPGAKIPQILVREGVSAREIILINPR